MTIPVSEAALRKKELESKTVAELRTLAATMGISLRARKKADIISEIVRAGKTGGRGTKRSSASRDEEGLVRPGPTVAPRPPERDMAVALAVEPTRIFAFWELREETARKGRPALRVLDVTGAGSRRPLEVKTGRRTGSLYIQVLPGRQYLVDAGVVTQRGRFISASKSKRISTPPAAPSGGEAELPESFFVFEPLTYRPGTKD